VSSFVFRKRREFVNEREIRLMVGDPLNDDAAITRDGRLTVPVDLNALCEEIVIGPQSPWLLDPVRSLCSRYGLDVPVRDSTLRRP